tara:strand:- start:12360 stop:13379 length:1020 start_codon:yes stop_codon:yes gene_type:complete
MKVDLRSDTVTKPTSEMKEFMFNAPVGDDVFEEDPTINELEKYAADLFGMEAALYCSSGTQTNQIAINVHCKPGDELICSKEAHIYKYEGGGIAKNSGTSVKLLDGDRGRITAQNVELSINDPENVHYPLTSLVCLEDTMNRGGGAIYDIKEIQSIRSLCDKHGLPLHLDGARVFNALVETGIDYKSYAQNFDSISICLSKGLGAPVGSVLIGSRSFIKKARRVRKVLGGGMRQAGIIAAGGLYALKNNIERLKDDHENARKLAQTLSEQPWIKDIMDVDTNIVVAQVEPSTSVDSIVNKLAEKDVHIMPFGKDTIRLVTHLDNSPEQINYAQEAIKNI